MLLLLSLSSVIVAAIGLVSSYRHFTDLIENFELDSNLASSTTIEDQTDQSIKIYNKFLPSLIIFISLVFLIFWMFFDFYLAVAFVLGSLCFLLTLYLFLTVAFHAPKLLVAQAQQYRPMQAFMHSYSGGEVVAIAASSLNLLGMSILYVGLGLAWDPSAAKYFIGYSFGLGFLAFLVSWFQKSDLIMRDNAQIVSILAQILITSSLVNTAYFLIISNLSLDFLPVFTAFDLSSDAQQARSWLMILPLLFNLISLVAAIFSFKVMRKGNAHEGQALLLLRKSSLLLGVIVVIFSLFALLLTPLNIILWPMIVIGGFLAQFLTLIYDYYNTNRPLEDFTHAKQKSSTLGALSILRNSLISDFFINAVFLVSLFAAYLIAGSFAICVVILAALTINPLLINFLVNFTFTKNAHESALSLKLADESQAILSNLLNFATQTKNRITVVSAVFCACAVIISIISLDSFGATANSVETLISPGLLLGVLFGLCLLVLFLNKFCLSVINQTLFFESEISNLQAILKPMIIGTLSFVFIYFLLGFLANVAFLIGCLLSALVFVLVYSIIAICAESICQNIVKSSDLTHSSLAQDGFLGQNSYFYRVAGTLSSLNTLINFIVLLLAISCLLIAQFI